MSKEEKPIEFGEVTETGLFGDPILTATNPEPKKEEQPKSEEKKDEGKEVPSEKELESKLEEQKEVEITFDGGEEQEENLEGKEEDEEKPKEEESETDIDDYSEEVKKYVEAGVWNEVDVETEDGKIDKDTFEEIKKRQKEFFLDEAKEEFEKNLTPFEKQLIEFKKNGGSEQDFIESYKTQQTVADIDLSTDMGKKSAILTYYSNFTDWDENKINEYLETVGSDETKLEKEAEWAKGKLEAATKEQHEQLQKQQAKQREAIEKAEADYRENLKSVFKDNGLDTKQANQYIRDFTEKDEKGYTKVTKTFVDMLQDPKNALELREFLLDRENYKKKVTQSKVNEENTKNYKKIVIAPSKKTKTQTEQQSNSKEKPIVLK